jgi:hypothetical protein
MMVRAKAPLSFNVGNQAPPDNRLIKKPIPKKEISPIKNAITY